MKVNYKLLALLLFSCRSKYIGTLETVKNHYEVIPLSVIRVNDKTIKVYGEVIPEANDEVYLIKKNDQIFVKLSSSNKLYLVKE